MQFITSITEEKNMKLLPTVYSQSHGDKTQYLTRGLKVMGMVAPKHFNVFRVTASFSLGDGDGYESQEVFIKDEDTLLSFLDFLFECAALYPNGKSGSKHYKDVEGYEEYVSDYWDYGEESKNKFLTWPQDPNMDDIYASFDCFEVVYFGATGQKHSVELEISEAM